MTKQDYVVKVLDKVLETWSKAPMIKEYILAHDDQGYIDYLYDNFVAAVDFALQQQGQDKIKQLVDYLDHIKQQELSSKQADEQDLKNLDTVLQGM